MKRAIILLWMLTIIIGCFAHLVETASLENFLIGSEPNAAYDNWVSHIAEGIAVANYNLYAPYDRQTNGFGDYRIPSATELIQWGEIVDLFLAGMLTEAQNAVTAAGFPYQVVLFNDTDSGRTYHMLREIPNEAYIDGNGTIDPYDDEIGAFAYGWGLYIYNPEGTRPIIITVPHPADDFPTPIIGYDALQSWDAAYLMITGAGREVRWTNSGSYTNTKSLSDPTRVALHPFNTAYKKFADKIRAETGKREFSFQIHSYDWNRHQGYTDNQISAGYNKLCPNLPIRDLSSNKNDLINKGNHLMIPANTIGIHNDVFLNQYYSVNYSVHPFTFSDGELEYPVNDYVDLPAYSQNQQMLYTLSGWNDYDSFEPFFHIEMDELPNMYEETENNYKWFYGWREAEAKWDYANTFTNLRLYYKRWVMDMESLYDDLFTMNDLQTPPAPQELTVVNESMYYVSLSWQKTDSYDFDSYEILYATSPITETNFQIFDRSNASFLASMACEAINVTGLTNTNNYYFRVRARDKNGNLSAWSNEVTTAPAPANISTFTTHGMTNTVRVYWSVAGQSNLTGFRIHRKAEGGDYIVIDSYETNPLLLVGSNTYEYWDNTAVNNVHYTYRIGMVNGNNYEFIHNVPQSASPSPIKELYISNASGTLSDTIYFAENPYATDGQDAYWDVSRNTPGSNYVWMAFWQQYWGNNGTHLTREVKGGYDLDSEVKTWTIRVKSDQLNVPLQISYPTFASRAEKVYLYDSGNGTWHNLLSGPYQFQVANANNRAMTLYWGNLQPKSTIGAMANQVLQGGNSVTFNWSNTNAFLIDHTNVYLKNATDSLSVLVNAPATTTSYSFQIPQSTEMPNAKLYLDVTATDGITTTYASPYTLAIVPRMNLFYCEPGWTTKANPFTQNTLSIGELFGSEAMVYGWNYDMGNWEQSNTFTHNVPYWVKATEYLFNSTTSNVQGTETTVSLIPGWNFIANPHLCSYNVSALRFMVNTTLFRYSEMITQNLISRGVYVYREGQYQLVDQILPYESFFIKSYGTIDLPISLNFYPYFNAPQITPPAPDWSVTVQAAGSDTDTFTFGASPIATTAYDFRVDIPKAPEKSLFPATNIYLNRSTAEGFLDSYLQEEYQSNFMGVDPQERMWNFSLDVDDITPVNISFATAGLPDTWTLRFVLEGVPFTIANGASFTFEPTAAGTYNGYIRVNNHPVDNNDLVQAVIEDIKVYPNPFSDNTRIAFTTSKNMKVKVDLYNIKGQKVCSLFDGQMSKGNQYLQWNGKDSNGRKVASGIYFAKVNSENKSKTFKMMLLK